MEHINNELVVPFLNVGWLNFNFSELVNQLEFAIRVFVLVVPSKVVLATQKLRGQVASGVIINWPNPVGQNLYRKLNTVLSLDISILDFKLDLLFLA